MVSCSQMDHFHCFVAVLATVEPSFNAVGFLEQKGSEFERFSRFSGNFIQYFVSQISEEI